MKFLRPMQLKLASNSLEELAEAAQQFAGLLRMATWPKEKRDIEHEEKLKVAGERFQIAQKEFAFRWERLIGGLEEDRTR